MATRIHPIPKHGSNGNGTSLDLLVSGPASATDHAVVRFDGTTGKFIQDSTALLFDSGDLQLTGGVIVSNTPLDTLDGTIKYDGTDFLGRVGGTWLSFTQSYSSMEGVWRWSTNTTPPPLNTYVMVNTADYTLATMLWVTKDSNTGSDYSATLRRLGPGEGVFIQDKNDSSLSVTLKVSGTGTEFANYWEYPVTFHAQTGGPLQHNQECAVVFILTVSGVNPGSGSGDVSGPDAATDHALARFDGATGKIIQNSVVVLTDTGDLSGVATLTTSGVVNGASPTELSYVAGATSNIQAQIDTLSWEVDGGVF